MWLFIIHYFNGAENSTIYFDRKFGNLFDDSCAFNKRHSFESINIDRILAKTNLSSTLYKIK